MTNGVEETDVEPNVEVAKNLSEEDEGEDDQNSLAESHAKRREEFSQRINQIQQAMSEAEEGNNVGTAEIAEEGGAAPTKKKEQKPSEPPITFREFEVRDDPTSTNE